MEFRLDDGQEELQQTVARFCEAHFGIDDVVERELQPVSRSSWGAMAELGVFQLFGSSSGDDGFGSVEAAIVYEQFGHHLVSGPVVWSLLASPLIDDAASGASVVTGVRESDICDGEAVVAHGAEADALLVVGKDRVSVHRIAELTVEPLDPLDPLTPMARLAGIGEGMTVGDTEIASVLDVRGTLLSAAMLVGVGARALEVARAYALERHQFGAPIGSFQAVKHMLADMYVRVSSAQSALYAAAVAVDGGSDRVRAAVSTAKVLAADCAMENSTCAVQVLGGMGFTWEMPPNYLLKRAWTLENEFGTTAEHEQVLAGAVSARG